MTPKERAVKAQQLLDDELLQRVLDGLENNALDACLRVNTTRPNSVISAVCQLKAAYAVRENLTQISSVGQAQERKATAVA